MQSLFTLKRDGYVIKVNSHEYTVNLDRVIPPTFFGNGQKFTEATEPKSTRLKPVKIQRDGDDLLIGGQELDVLLRQEKQFDSLTPYTEQMYSHIHLHPNIGIVLFYLQDERFVNERYLLREDHAPMEIIFKGRAFRSHLQAGAYWFALRRVNPKDFHLSGEIKPADPKSIFGSWKNIAA